MKRKSKEREKSVPEKPKNEKTNKIGNLIIQNAID